MYLAIVGEYAPALPLMQQALESRCKVLGPEHAEHGRHHRFAGRHLLEYRRSGQGPAALSAGPGNPPKGAGVGKSADGREPQHARGDLPEHGELRQGVAVGAGGAGDPGKVLGPEHPDTATSYSDLADLYAETGEFAERCRCVSGPSISAVKSWGWKIPTRAKVSTISGALPVHGGLMPRHCRWKSRR